MDMGDRGKFFVQAEVFVIDVFCAGIGEVPSAEPTAEPTAEHSNFTMAESSAIPTAVGQSTFRKLVVVTEDKGNKEIRLYHTLYSDSVLCVH